MHKIALKSFFLRIIILLCYIVFFSEGIAQNQITFRQLSVKDGLSQNSAVSISQDSIGFLWIATQDGLNKYDGKKFTTYPFSFIDITKPNYSNLGKVYTDRKGEVWIIPISKIPHKLNREFNVFEPISTIDDASVIYQDTNFNYWIGTYSSGLYLINPYTYKSKKIVSTQQLKGTVFQIAENKNSDLILTSEKQIIELNLSSNIANYIKPQTIYGDSIKQNFSTIVFDKNERQWIGTYGDGLYFRDKKDEIFNRISKLSFTDPLPIDLNILALYIDSKGRLWIASYGRGLYMIDFENTKISHFKVEKQNPKALHYNDILNIYEDYSGTLWFGSDGAGVSYYDEYLEKFNSFINFQTPENISIDVIRAITTDANNNIWLGTSGKGLTQYKPATNSWRTFNTNIDAKNTISSNRIMSLFVDDDNVLWIGTQAGGLNLLDTSNYIKKYTTTSNPFLSAITIWDIFKDNQNRFWLGTRDNGLIQFNKTKGEIKKYTIIDSLPSNNIRVIEQSNSNSLWLGTEENGVVLFDMKKETFKQYKFQSNKNSLSNNKIKTLYYDSKDILWIGTNGGGLNAFDTKKEYFYHFTTKDGLANNVIYAVLPDKNGNLWLSSNKGITKFTQGKSLEDPPKVINYDNYAGLATEFNTGAYYIDSKFNLYFGGLDGFYWFNPNNIEENRILPKTTITGFEVLDEPQLLKQGTKLKHNQNTLSFTFSSLQYSLPEKNMYQYQLLNYDKDWVQAGNNNFVRYPQIPPGDYEFRVKSSNYDGVWNEIPETFKFSIATPWYLTTLARTIYVLLLLITIFGIYSYLKWRWRIQLDLQLKEKEAERFKKLNDFKSKLYTDISHEFRTPLTLISGPIDAKLGEGKISDSDFANFSMIKRNTNRLLSLVDQLLDLAKLDKGNLKLKIFQGKIDLFLNNIAASFDYKSETKKINYTINIESIKNAWYDEDILEKIVTNLLSNAFKYSPENGICMFIVKRDISNIEIHVKNTTENLSEVQLEDLFTRFYQKDEYAEGAGIGLSLVRELIQLYNGEISVNLEKDNVIDFMVILPIYKKSFNKEDILKESLKKETPNTVILDTIDVEQDFVIEGNENEIPILLVVDDHTEVRQFIKSILKHKYQVFEAENGKQGIKKAMQLVPDIIISDVRMPICDGIELCNSLKADELTSHIPIVLLTAGTGEEKELKGLQSGADDFITKPFKLRILETKIANLIEIRKSLRSRYSQEFILKPKEISITSTDEAFLNKIQQILDKHLSNPDFNAVSFSKELAMSRMQLHRKLLAYTGISTSAFIRSQRLKQALHILKTSDATINEVAYMVGFNTPSYFIKCFKEAYKKTPSEYFESL
ncbi:Signal transduction histidine kinase [Flaviramulus basaltis]|uniref:histidine kinase n=1 Tax=Flaviramulus basaltis TaxID=369401 RepID=A0A1K2IMI5_9FLAO|nr:two-component regulator propeller domain-containing protein [Flaviramulus basaltis]SFZ93416.1 Signal transduction histidine kinase [Flaviramulus basaltis]